MNTDTNSSKAHSETKSDRHPGSRHIIVAEDDNAMRSLVSLSLRQHGYEVVECGSGVELVDHLKQFSEEGDRDVDLVISDIRMPGVTGIEVLEGLREDKASPPVILITAFGDTETHSEAKRLGAAAILDKPFAMDTLVDMVHHLVPL